MKKAKAAVRKIERVPPRPPKPPRAAPPVSGAEVRPKPTVSAGAPAPAVVPVSAPPPDPGAPGHESQVFAQEGDRMEQCFGTSAQDFMTRMQQAGAHGQAALQDSLAAAQDGGKRLLDSALAHAHAGIQDQQTFAAELTRVAAQATSQAVTALQKQAELCAQLPADPCGSVQRLIAGSIEATQHAAEAWTGAMQASLNVVAGACTKAVQAGREANQIVSETAHKVQTIVRETAARG
jgi:hypothetical protein